MTDLEFYQKALSFQSWLVNRISEIKAYGKHWSDEFCLNEIRNATEKYFTDDNVKEVFKLDNLTRERAKALRFVNGTNTSIQTCIYFLFGSCFSYLMELR